MTSVDKKLASSCFAHVKKVEQIFKDGDSFVEKEIESDLVEEDTDTIECTTWNVKSFVPSGNDNLVDFASTVKTVGIYHVSLKSYNQSLGAHPFQKKR
jgi:hypothetical protein